MGCLVNFFELSSVDWTQAATIAIAITALGLSVWEGVQNRMHNRLSVRPILSMYTHTDLDTLSFHSTIQNNGLGPAIISSYRIFLDGKELQEAKEDPADTLKSCLKIAFNLPEECFQHYRSGGFKSGYAIKPDSSFTLAKVIFKSVSGIDEALLEQAGKRVNIVVEYNDIYGKPCGEVDTHREGDTALPTRETAE